MAYTKKLEIRIDGSMLEWQIDLSNSKIKIYSEDELNLTTEQLRSVNDILESFVRICSICPDIKSIEYSDI